MTNLPCGIVQDLMPSYIDGLSCEETNEAVLAHIENCSECRQALDAMREKENRESADNNKKDVQYLKKIKRRSKIRVFSAVLATICALALVILLKLCVIGSPADPSLIRYASTVDADANTVQVSMMPIGGGTKLIDEKLTVDNDGRALISVKKARCLFGARADRMPCSVTVPLGDDNGSAPLSSIYIGDRLIWQYGLSISEKTIELYAARTPYIGNASAVGKIANLLGISSVCGNYLMSLQTSAEPYGMTLEFQEPCGDTEALNDNMNRFSSVLIALVDNLDRVSWTYTDSQGNACEQTVGSGDVLPQLNLKDCGKSELALQRLLNSLGL
ncbi:MAG: DUF4825 domain-containing protein [Oscillospiraceae bacterium]|nr:DUF4825 domain-containing protein [Oscillospiraceae bacterium]